MPPTWRSAPPSVRTCSSASPCTPTRPRRPASSSSSAWWPDQVSSGLIHSGDSQMARSSSSSRHESRNCRQRHPSGPPSILSSLPFLMFNHSRELVPFRGRPSYLTQSAMERLFDNQPQLLGPYQRAIEAIVASNGSQVGLILGGDSWEYPVWRMLRDRKLVRIEHVNVSGNPRWPLGPFFPDVVFWSLGEGEPPPRLAVDGREFVRIRPPTWP